MWRGIFTDLLTTIGIFAVAFMIGRGVWPSKYRAMKRRWADARAETKYLRAQLEDLQKNRKQPTGDELWDPGANKDDD